MRLLVLVFLSLLAFQTLAEGRANHFKVVHVRVDKSGKGYVKFDKRLAYSPASCGGDHPSHLAFDMNTAGGKGIMSLALAAHSSGKRIQAYGTGSCDIYGPVESWNWGFIVD